MYINAWHYIKQKSYFIHWNSSLSIKYDETNKHDKWYFWNTMHYYHFRKGKNYKITIHKRIQKSFLIFLSLKNYVCLKNNTIFKKPQIQQWLGIILTLKGKKQYYY